MSLIYLFLILAFFIDVRPVFMFKNCNENYLSKDECLSIKGVFVFLVFLSHASPYISQNAGDGNLLNQLFFKFTSLIGQLMVVMFFFYSGYGIFEQVKRKGTDYVHSFIRRRFFPTYFSFVICVFLYLLLSFFIHKEYSILQILLSFVGWESIGNSNWFMFVTFVLYLLFVVSFSIPKQNKSGLIIFTIISIAFLVILILFKESWWWNTFLCFPLGMWWSCFKEKFESFLFSDWKNWLSAFVLSFALFVCFYVIGRKIPLLYICTSAFFALTVCLATVKIDCCKGVVFGFLGKHVFSIYILQRLVFIIVEYMCASIMKIPALFLVICFVLTIIIAYLYDFCFEKIRQKCRL
jgi:peptidoglycan/LPS O-acetylase OafA/YrhL